MHDFTTHRRFLIRAKIPTEAGNKMVQNLKNLEEYMNKAKPEAA
jgi:hypothetical protein